MTDFKKFNATSHPIVKLEDDWNNLLDHGLEKYASYIIRRNGSLYEAIEGGSSTGAGTIAFGGADNAGGTSGTDASAVANAAFAAVPAAFGEPNWGGTFLFKRGYYELDVPLTPKTFQSIIGEGEGTDFRPSSSWVGNYLIESASGAGIAIKLRDFRMFGANTCGGILLQDSWNFWLDNLSIWGCTGKSIALDNCAHYMVTDTIIDSLNYGDYGIWIDADVEILISNIILERVGVGIYVTNASRGTITGITGSHASNNPAADCLLELATCSRFSISNVNGRYWDENVFLNTNCESLHFTNCVGEHAENDHVFSLYDSHDCTVTNCTFGYPATAAKASIYVSDGGVNIAERNTFNGINIWGMGGGIADYGIYESGSATNNVYSNITFSNDVDVAKRYRANPATETSMLRNSPNYLGIGETRTYYKTVNFDDASPVAVCSVGNGHAVTDVWVEIVTTFDGGGVINIGDGGTADGFLATANINEGVAGYYGYQVDNRGAFLYDVGGGHQLAKIYGSDDTIDCFITPAAATQGKAIVYVKVTNIGAI